MRLLLLACAALMAATPASAQMRRRAPAQTPPPASNGPRDLSDHVDGMPSDMQITSQFPESSSWRLADVDGKPVPPGTYPTFSIDSTYRASGNSGCNTYSMAFYPQKNHTMLAGPIATTKKQCDAAANTLERIMLTTMHSGPVWSIKDGYFVLKGPSTLRFARGF